MLQGGPDVNSLPVLLVLAAMGIGLVVWLMPRQLRRTRQLGGRPSALFVVGGAVVLVGISLQPEIVGVENGLALTLIGIVLALRPEAVVRYTGGPRPEYVALEEGTQLQRAVAKHHDRRVAQHTEEVKTGLVRLEAAAYPPTERYIELIQATLFQDPEGPGMADRFAALAVEEAKLRKVIGPKPAFEGGLVEIDEAEPPAGPDDDEMPDDGAGAGDAAEPPAGPDDEMPDDGAGAGDAAETDDAPEDEADNPRN